MPKTDPTLFPDRDPVARTASKPPGAVVSGTAVNIPYSCPNCGRRVKVAAGVEKFGEPDGWEFYGEAGNRAILCQGEQGGRSYYHFRAGQSSRLAWIRSEV